MSYCYIFEESPSPTEIIEVRRVKARVAGADCFGMQIAHTGTEVFNVDQQAMWGGLITSEPHVTEAGNTVIWRRFDFAVDSASVKNTSSRFAPGSSAPQSHRQRSTSTSHSRARQVAIHLTFNGNQRPAAAWSFGPATSGESAIGPSNGAKRLPVIGVRSITTRFRNPEIGPTYGLNWTWCAST